MTNESLEQRARELLAQQYDGGYPEVAEMLRTSQPVGEDHFAIRAIIAALESTPAQGVEHGALRALVTAANAVLAENPADDGMWTLEQAVRPFNATKPAECANGCPTNQVCDYCQYAAPVARSAVGGVSQSMLDAGTAAMLAFRKSGDDWTGKPAHAAEAAIRAALSARTAPAEGEPDPALLVSMATCLNHGFGLLETSRQESILHDMRKLWDEVQGRGYYKPERRDYYMGMVDTARPAKAEGDGNAADVQKWKDRYFDRRRIISQWHNEAVALGYDGVADLLACIEQGEPPQHIAELLARTVSRGDA